MPRTLAIRRFTMGSTCRILNSVGAFSAVCGRLISFRLKLFEVNKDSGDHFYLSWCSN